MASKNKTGRRVFSAQPYGKTAPNPTRKKAGGERLLARIQNPREVVLAEPAPAAIPTKRETGETDNHLQVRMRRFRENRAVLYPGVEIAPSPYPNDFTIGVLSRLDPEKGTKEFLRLMTPLLENHPAWRLLIAGVGREESAIKQIAAAHPQMHLLGLVSERREFFAEISVLAYPTGAEETFGLSLLEAQSCGRPVVASRRGAIPEAVAAGESGFLIPPADTALWAEALEKLSGRETFPAMSDAALKQAEQFSVVNFEQGLRNLMVTFKTDK